ncbi:hypothetical protein BCR33DRAFT_451481 [Rhizoclosmatium globosum]|uniref:G-protein coupled receptors family 3 profile domain-containing protein n=1 Tax=Rhizoclosmatium globosum TaxID=329046 RepID=A0A1Y2CW68_9FUNG|nr:hypothetical protein BCR33DRAFT_451481 [Rhizoclosmatium globosum]|eukprot:ORY51278.1 hypothetical protein BCR33DRAFT_451481 [Rhizoclosmatium globosum]
MNATYFWYYPNARPIFSSGFSYPPPDGPPIVVTQEDMISSSSSNGGLVLFFAASGFVGCSAALIFVWWFRRERVVRQSSVYFLVPIVMGYMLLSVSLFTLLDRVSVAKCVGRIWLQVLGFAVIMSVLLVKVYRNGVQLQRRVTTAKKIGIKKLGWDMIAILVTVAFFELILLGLWTAAPHSTKLTSSQTSFMYTCVDPTYSHPTTIALLVANLILLCITASVAFNTEDQEFFIGEAKYPALITVTFAFTALIVLPLLATADPPVPSTFLTQQEFGSLFGSLSFPYSLPKYDCCR